MWAVGLASDYNLEVFAIFKQVVFALFLQRNIADIGF